MRKILIANRGEIAVRVARACRDAGLASVAVYADPTGTRCTSESCDEAFALGGDTAAESYLDIGKVLGAAAVRGRRRSIPATASWPKTPNSPRRSSTRG